MQSAGFVQSFQASLRSLLKPNRLAILEACIIGVVSGLAAIALRRGAAIIGGWRLNPAFDLPIWIWIPLFAATLGGVIGFAIERFAPEAVGSGIPQVKAALSHAPATMNLRVALVKLVTTIMALGSGVPLGRQGPSVQVGAALAGQLSRWVPTSPEYRRQLIAAGAAAGLASGFNAPIAGVLFVIEELLQDLSGLTLGTAIIASFIGAVVSRLFDGQGLDASVSIMADAAGITLQEIPLLLLLGFLAGGLGGIFSRGILASCRFSRQQLRLPPPLRMLTVGLIVGLVVALLPPEFRDSAGLQESLLQGSRTWQMSAVAFSFKFVLTLLAYGAGVPGGLFAPALLLGSALGDLLSFAALALPQLPFFPAGWVIELSSPSTYALAGMGAFFAAVTKGPITAIVIVFEMTNDFNLVLPLMVASITAYGVSNGISRGSVYNHLLAMDGIDLTSKTRSANIWDELRASGVMQRQVETLEASATLESARQTFNRSHHRGFPVVEKGRLVGIISRSDVVKASARLEDSTSLRQIMTPQPITVQPQDTLATVLHLLTRHQVSRLPVTEGQRLVGIITRADIIRAESEHMEGADMLLPQPTEPSYVVYQTRGPNVGQGRLLVPLANPQSAPTLLQMAGAIARHHRYELECLQVIVVPRHQSPSETQIRIDKSLRLLQKAMRLAQDWKIPVHTQIRVTHDVSQAILETIQERHIDLTILGWRGQRQEGPGRIFNDTLDTLIRQAPGRIMLIKLGQAFKADIRYPSLFARLHLNRWLIPTSGGPNTEAALELLPALTTLSGTPQIQLFQIQRSQAESSSQLRSEQSQLSPPPFEQSHDQSQLEPSQNDRPTVVRGEPSSVAAQRHQQQRQTLWALAHQLQAQLDCPVQTTFVCANSVAEAVVDMAHHKQCDVIVLGVSRESLLRQVVSGNVSEAIARQSHCTVILMRGLL